MVQGRGGSCRLRGAEPRRGRVGRSRGFACGSGRARRGVARLVGPIRVGRIRVVGLVGRRVVQAEAGLKHPSVVREAESTGRV